MPPTKDFAEAAQQWYLDRLYVDLAKAKQVCVPHARTGLSDTEKVHLRGLLCGYSPDEIASKLNKTPTGVKPSLTKTLYRYVEQLTGRSPNTLGNWRDVVDWLEAEYKIRSFLVSVPRREDWGDAPDVALLKGRYGELSSLTKWIVQDGCRLVAIVGMGGMGKTRLGVKVAKEIAHEFEYVIWRSLADAPTLRELLGDLLEFLSYESSEQVKDTHPEAIASTAQKLSQLMKFLQRHRCLVILDDVEMILASGEFAGYSRQGYQDYSQLFQKIGEVPLRSCLLLLSGEKPIEVASLEGPLLPVRCLQLAGLQPESAQEILIDQGLCVTDPGFSELIRRYGGHPAALKIVSTTIGELFKGNILQFLQQSSLIVGDALRNILDRQFSRLSELEIEIIYGLAIHSQPVSANELQGQMWSSVSGTELVGALDSLKRRSLIENISEQPGEILFSLPPVMKKYVVNQFIYRFVQNLAIALETQKFKKMGLVRTHALVNLRSSDSFKLIQSRTILTRVRDALLTHFKGEENLEEKLTQLLSDCTENSSADVGYIKLNLKELLQSLNGYRKGHDQS